MWSAPVKVRIAEPDAKGVVIANNGHGQTQPVRVLIENIGKNAVVIGVGAPEGPRDSVAAGASILIVMYRDPLVAIGQTGPVEFTMQVSDRA